MRMPAVLLLVACLVAVPAVAGGINDGFTPAKQLARPDSDGPTPVDIGLHLFDIVAIDDVRQIFDVDMFLLVRWQDKRLALAPDLRTGGLRRIPMDEIWTPDGLVINDRGLTQQLERVADVDDDGNVVFRQRLIGELAANLAFKEFPFDEQRLPIDFVSYRYGPDELPLTAWLFTGNTDEFSAEGWSFELLEPSTSAYAIPELNLARSQVSFAIKAKRNSDYYLLTMMLPLSLIIFMSWTAFWIQPDVVPSRIAISTASIFSLIAFGFSVRLGLPQVPYMTRADMFVFGCTLLVFVALAVAVTGSRWAGANKLPRAVRLNAITRWAYVGLFGLVVLSALYL